MEDDRPVENLKLDFEDLVSELNQFEREAEALQERIAQFMDNARQAIESGTASDPDAETPDRPQGPENEAAS